MNDAFTSNILNWVCINVQINDMCVYNHNQWMQRWFVPVRARYRSLLYPLLRYDTDMLVVSCEKTSTIVRLNIKQAMNICQLLLQQSYCLAFVHYISSVRNRCNPMCIFRGLSPLALINEFRSINSFQTVKLGPKGLILTGS